MNYNTIIIILIIITVTISGYYINFIRNNNTSEVISEAKDNSLLIFRMLIPIALLVSLMLLFFKIGAISVSIYFKYIGYSMVIIGLITRWVAVKSLGNSFRVKVSLIKNQQLITSGIYTKIRHPSYTGLLLYYIGLGIIMQNYLSLLLLTFIPFYVVIHRIILEEKFMVNSFQQDYLNYQKKTYKLFPFIY